MKSRRSHLMSVAKKVMAQLILMPVLVISLETSAEAQNAEEQAEQQRKVMRQYMEASGMSAEQIAELEAISERAMNPIVEQQAAQDTAAQADFEAQTSGRGQAALSILGKDIEMPITRCETGVDGDFFVEAKEGPGRRQGWLTVRGDSHYKRTEVQLLSPGIGFYEVHIRPMRSLEGGRFSWTGTATGDRGPAELVISLQCGDGS